LGKKTILAVIDAEEDNNSVYPLYCLSILKYKLPKKKEIALGTKFW
jgi:hypothetical protein